MSNKLTANFINELFRLLFIKKSILDICNKHFKYQFIPKELPEYKLIYQSAINQYTNTGNIPSIGVTSQQYANKPEVQQAISEIKESPIQDQELIITQLEKYIKSVEFTLMNEKIVELYSKGEQDEAIELSTKESQRIQTISLRNDGGKFVRVFADFHKDNEKRKQDNQEEENKPKTRKVPFFIDPLDDLTHGGMDAGETALWILPSGGGKSTALRYTGLKAAVHGYDVLHIQLEGTEDEARDKYTQLYTKQDYDKIKSGNLPKEALVKIEALLKQMEQSGREVFIYAFEKFEGASMKDIKEVVLEYEKINGKFPELIIIDSLDLCATGENKKIDSDPSYKKDKMDRVAQLMKNLAIECFPARILTSTQTSSIEKAKLNDPEFVITRANTEGNRTLVKPFSSVFSGNQTDDEEESNELRVYVDKLRYYSKKEKVFPVCTNFDKGAFYSQQRTLEKFYNKGDL